MSGRRCDRTHGRFAPPRWRPINFNPRSLRGATVGISEYAVSLFGGVLNTLTIILA